MTTPLCEAAPDAAVLTDEALHRVRELVENHVLALAMPATAASLAEEMTAFDRVALGTDAGSAVAAVESVMTALVSGGVLREVPGGFVPRELPADVSRRARTFSLSGRAAIALGRAVRVADVWRYANEHASEDVARGALTVRAMARDMGSLTYTKDLVVVAVVRGAAADGSNLVVPSHFRSMNQSWAPTESLTWLDYLAGAMRRMLAGTGRETFAAKELRAFVTRDQQDRAAAGHETPHGYTSALRMRTALVSLATCQTPVVRAVPCRSAVWMLVPEHPDSKMDPASSPAPTNAPYASDTDRVMEAARRVTRATERPVVRCDEVRDVIAEDPALALTGTSSVSQTLAELAKSRLAGDAGRVQRRHQRVRKVGMVHGHAVYWVETGHEDEARYGAAQRFVESRGVFDAIDACRFVERIADVEQAVSPIIAAGRMRQLLQDVEQLIDRARALPADTETREERLQELDAHRDAMLGWLRFRGAPATGTLTTVQQQTVGLTAQALRAVFAPINSKAAEVTDTGRLVSLYSSAIRRVPNPRFAGLRSGDPATAAKFLFDQVDALTYAARQWGGPTCQLHALAAAEELGDLRDVRYVLAALRTDNAEVRQRVIATLALLPSPDAAQVLAGHVRNDVVASVRECALWALGMVLGEAANSVLHEVATQDPDPRVRRTAIAFQSVGGAWWWCA